MEDKKTKTVQPEKTDPITFMKGRHPDLYSDSAVVSTPQLSEDILGYQLETLTNRNQETEFAYFARRLAQKELCPNIRPQTGPVGGGDSKVDGETIPVSSNVADTWVGIDPKAANERWAFAFSAKKAWKSKVADDVKKIAGTDRDYKRIYFITNQFAPDKSRAESEDALTKKFGIPVTILDRTWITKAVLENGREELAIETLHIDSLKVLQERKLGPADRERQEELDELEKAISDPELYIGAQYQLFEDCLRAALLARGLGRPQTEMDGLFIRAQKIAETADDNRLRLRVAYNFAWTSIFWFDSYQQLNQMYDLVESLALQSSQAGDVEKAVNLWMVLSAQVGRGVLTEQEAKLGERRSKIIARLNELSNEASRPNNSLEAQTCLALLELQSASQDPTKQNAIWKKFQEIVEAAQSLGDYPFERLVQLASEFADMGVESVEFDKLFELIISAHEKRRGEATGAELLSERGVKKLEAGRTYEAISLLGRAMERFIKREQRENLIHCLMCLSQAYKEAGLLWAARSCALAATERCLTYFQEDGTIVRRSLLCLQQLEQMELLLGRIPQLLMALELEALLLPQFMLKEDALRRAQSNRELMECMLGILFLSASIEQLKLLANMPEALEMLAAVIPKGCLLYALGYKAELLKEGFPNIEEAEAFMKMAYEQPGRLQLPARPQIDDGKFVSYTTNILGCEINLVAAAEAFSISIAEAILSSLEAFFATSLNESILPYKQSAKIVLRPTDDVQKGLVITEETEGSQSYILVSHPKSAPKMTVENRTADRDGLMELIPKFMLHIAVVNNVEGYFDKIAGEERGFARALIYAESSLAQENLFGKHPKVLVSDWKSTGDLAKTYPLLRTVEWTDGVAFNQIPLPSDENEETDLSKNDGQIRTSFERIKETGKHSQQQIISLIDIPLWDRATWRGVVFITGPGAPIPVLAVGFKNGDEGEKIFKQLIDKIGKTDEKGQLRVLIVRGITKKNSAAYRVVIGANLSQADKGKIVKTVMRSHVIQATTTANLDRFLSALSEDKNFLLAPIQMTDRPTTDVKDELSIKKSQIVVRNAWEIGEGDIDVMGLASDDDPLIPEGENDPPCKKVLELLRSIHNKHNPID